MLFLGFLKRKNQKRKRKNRNVHIQYLQVHFSCFLDFLPKNCAFFLNCFAYAWNWLEDQTGSEKKNFDDF